MKPRQYGQLLVLLVLFVVKYPNIRVKFATFMQELQDALHHKGLLYGAALIHKISERPEEDPSFKGNLFEDWRLEIGDCSAAWIFL